MCGYFVKGGTSYPLSASPAFMIERPELPGLDTILWINVLCPNESEFHWAVEEAKKRPNSRRRTWLPANSMRRSTMSSIDTGRPQRAILTHFSGGTGSRLQRQRMTAHMTAHTGERFTGLSQMISKRCSRKLGWVHQNAETRSANFFKNGGSSNVEVLPSPQSEACYKKAAGQDRRHSDLSISAA